MTILTMPTPEELEAEAVELEAMATKKERQAAYLEARGQLTDPHLRTDAAIFRSEAASKRAKAERLRKADDDAARVQLETEGAGFAPPDEAFDFQQ